MPEEKKNDQNENAAERLAREVTEKDELLVDPDKTTDQLDDEVTPLDDDKTSRAIDDILVNESDELLMAQDATAGKVSVGVKKSLSAHWWHRKWLRRVVLLLILGGATAGLAIPASRYWLLNTATVRVSASVVVVDGTNQLPLKGVQVHLGDRKAKTNGDGQATVAGLKQGAQTLVVDQTGFASVKRSVVLGLGSNPLDNIALKATGVQYVIEARDYLSEKPLEGVEAANGEATAISGKDGKITLTLASTAASKDPVSLSKSGYRTEQITLNADPRASLKATLVIAHKAVFVSKTAGKSDVIKSDIDGQNRAVLLAGTGHENSNISLAVSPDGSRVAVVSTRDNKRDAGGFLLSSLALVDVEDGSTVTIAQSPQIQLVDWIGSRLIFQQVSSDSSDTNRYKVIAYNYADNTRVQLAAANKLNGVLSAQGSVYYAVANSVSDASMQVGLFKINPDGNNKQTIIKQEVLTLLRSSYIAFNAQTADETWYTHTIASSQTAQVAMPTSLASRSFVDNADRSKSVWASEGTLKGYDIASGKEATLKTQSGLTYPVQWLSTTAAIYRLATTSETADYAVSLEGGTPHKVADVAPAYGFIQN